MNIALIFAGGSGVRMGAGIPKQFLEVNGKPIIIHTTQLFEYHTEIDKIYIGINEEYVDYMKRLAEDYHLTKVADVIPGGNSAQETIYRLLVRAGEENPEDSIVLIHDGVRPFVTYDVISKNIESVKEYGNAVTATSCNETIMISETGIEVGEVPPRKYSYAAQAPQSFYLKDIKAAHEAVQKTPGGYTDMVDACTIIRSQGVKAHIVEGNRGNIKVTVPVDFYMFRALLQYQENEQAFGLGLTNQINARMMASKKKGN